MLDITIIDRYFQTHPLSASYFGFSADDRRGAAAVAERDASAALDHEPVDEAHREVFAAAVAEQCLHLLLNPEKLTGRNDGVTSESSAGAHRSYREQPSPLCRRAAALLAPLKPAGGTVTINRG